MARLLPALLVLGLLPPTAGARCPADATTASFLAPGQFGVGVRSLVLEDTSRPTAAHGGAPEKPSRTLTTEVWYPTAPGSTRPVRDAPLAPDGSFPLVVSSHGYSDLRVGAAYLAIALASRGFVVAAPDFPLTNLATPGGPLLEDVRNQPDDVRFVIDRLLALSRTGGEWLAGGVDRKRIGVSGLSLGGLTTLLVAYHPTLRDRRVRAVAALAPAACYLSEVFYRAARPPLLLVNGDADYITPLETNAGHVLARSRSPRQLLTLAGATHTAFSGLVDFPSVANYDVGLGCMLLEVSITQADVDATIASFASTGRNLTDTTSCALPCTGPPPAGVPMPATRQHEITQAAVTAFFESTLRRSRPARCFLRDRLASENTEVTSTVEPARPLKTRRPPRSP